MTVGTGVLVAIYAGLGRSTVPSYIPFVSWKQGRRGLPKVERDTSEWMLMSLYNYGRKSSARHGWWSSEQNKNQERDAPQRDVNTIRF